MSSGDDYLFGRRTTLAVFSMFCLMMLLDFADRMIVAALLPSIKAEWGISDSQAGLLASALFVGMVVFAIPAALAIDRWSRVRTAALMGGFWSLASGAGAFAQSLSQLAITRAAVGVGEAGYAPAATAWIVAAFPKRRRQLAIGTFSAGQPIGMAVGVALGGYIAAHYGWRHALGIVALPGILLALLLYRARDYQNTILTAPSGVQAGVRESLGTIFGISTLRYLFLNSAMVVMQFATILYFLPTYLTRIHALPLDVASYMTSSAVLVGAVGSPLGGWIMDAWSIRRPDAKVVFALLMAISSTILCGLAFGVANAVGLQYGLILIALFALSAGTSGPLAMTQELVHPGIRALSMTCNALAAHLLGSVPGPVLTGVISDRANLTVAMLSVTVAGGLMAIFALGCARRHYLEDLARVAQVEPEVESSPRGSTDRHSGDRRVA